MAPAWDAIVIGSGIGGMSAAGFLAKVARDEGPGAGEALGTRRPDARVPPRRRLLGRRPPLRRRAADGLDHAHACSIFSRAARSSGTGCPTNSSASSIPASHSPCPPTRSATQARLIERFPDEARGDPPLFPRPARRRALARPRHPAAVSAGAVGVPFRPMAAAGRGQGDADDRRVPSRHFRSPSSEPCSLRNGATTACRRAKAPSRCTPSWSSSYFNGGWFPQGGAGRIARTIEPGIEASGGAIKVSHEVTAILTEGGRAVGVQGARSARRRADRSRLSRADRHLRRRRAPHLSHDCCRPTARSAGGPPSRAPMSTRWRAACRRSRSISGSTEPVSTLGVKGENYWINTTFDHDDIDGDDRGDPGGRAATRLSVVSVGEVGRRPVPHRRGHRVRASRGVRPPGAARATGQRGRDYRRTQEPHRRRPAAPRRQRRARPSRR